MPEDEDNSTEDEQTTERDGDGDPQDLTEDPGSLDGQLEAAPETEDSAHPILDELAQSPFQRLSRTFLRPASTGNTRGVRSKSVAEVPNFASMSDDDIRRRITQIDPKERRIGYVLGAIGMIIGVLVPFVETKVSEPTGAKPTLHHKACTLHQIYTTNGKTPPTCNRFYPSSHFIPEMLIILVFAIGILLTVRYGKRAPVAFAIVLTGLAIGSFLIVIPYLGVGGWLLYRSYRTQKYGTPTARNPVEGYVRPAPRGARAPRPPRQPRPKRGASRAAPPSNTQRSAPSASKRYTPKGNPKKR